MTGEAAVRLAPAPLGRDADVIVVGGGPAGAAAAFHLARAGFDTLIVDKAAFPRDKVCGDFVGPVGLGELAVMGVAAELEAAAANRIGEAAVFLDGDHVLSRPLPHRRGYRDHGLVVPREQLDGRILAAAAAAGARVAERTGFTAYRAGAGGVEVDVSGPGGDRTLRGALLVGADGSNSQVARQLRGRIPARDRIMAVRAYFDRVAGPPGRADLLFHTTTFPGYTWVFPTGPESANVGVGMASDLIPRSEEHLRPLLERLVTSDPALAERLGGAAMVGRVKGFPLATYNPAAPLTAPRLALVGDAAGMINPINGEGIQYALLTGRWLAQEVAAAGPSPPALVAYRRRVRAELGADLALARLIVQTISNRDLNPVWLKVLGMVLDGARTDPAYAELAGGILAGLRPTTTALRWGMLGRLATRAAGDTRVAAAALAAEPLQRSASLGVGAARMGFQIVHDAAADPERFRGWMEAVIRSGASVGSGLARQAVAVRRRPRAGSGTGD